jgi:hypothetical protein
MKIIYYFSLILWLTGCSWITSSNTKIVISLGEERALKKSINLPFGYLELLILRVTSLDGSTIYKEKFFSIPSEAYSLEVDDLAEGNVYRATAIYKNYSSTQYMDTRQFFLSGFPQTISLYLGHTFSNIEFRTLDTNTLIDNHDYPNIFTSELDKALIESESGVKIILTVPSQHHSSFTTFDYRFNNGVWNTSSIHNSPEIESTTFNSIQIRYRQESNGEWLLYTFNCIYY